MKVKTTKKIICLTGLFVPYRPYTVDKCTPHAINYNLKLIYGKVKSSRSDKQGLSSFGDKYAEFMGSNKTINERDMRTY